MMQNDIMCQPLMLCSTLQMDIAGGVTNFRRRVLSFKVNILSDGWGNKFLVFHSFLILFSPFPFSPSSSSSLPPSSSHTSSPLPFLSLPCSLHPFHPPSHPIPHTCTQSTLSLPAMWNNSIRPGLSLAPGEVHGGHLVSGGQSVGETRAHWPHAGHWGVSTETTVWNGLRLGVWEWVFVATYTVGLVSIA